MGEPRLVAPQGKALTKPRAVVLVLHGGSPQNSRPVGPTSSAWWRMRWFARRISRDLRARNIDVRALKHRMRGWNAGSDGSTEPAPVTDARWALAKLHEEFPGVPIALVGHSMGGRTAVAVADDPSVWLAVGLAPWWPPEDSTEQLTGRDVVGAHGHRDKTTDIEHTRAFLRRARQHALSETFVDMGASGHYLLSQRRDWAQVVIDAVIRHSSAKDRAAAA